MPQEFDLRLDGEPVQIKSGELVLTFDTPSDGFSAQTKIDRINNPGLYDKISPYKAPAAQIYLNNELMLTGRLTQTKQSKSETGRVQNLSGWSNTFNFVDSALKPPYEIRNRTLHSLAIIVGRQTATKIVHTGPDGNRFDKATITAGQSASQFLAPLAAQRNHVISSTINGDILLQQADLNQNTIGMIEEDSPGSLLQKEFSAKYNLRDRFKTYRVKSRTPAGAATAIATDRNITLPRHKLASADNQIAGAIQEAAEYAKNIELIKTLSQDIPIIGWNIPSDGPIVRPGQLVTLKSETFFTPDGFTYFIRAVKYQLSGSSKTAVLSLIPKEIYSGEPVIEPWFDNSSIL